MHLGGTGGHDEREVGSGTLDGSVELAMSSEGTYDDREEQSSP